jgi:Cytochrome bd terminal oxidase subunit I
MTGTVTANLARAQFALTISFHFIFPAFTIGVARGEAQRRVLTRPPPATNPGW